MLPINFDVYVFCFVLLNGLRYISATHFTRAQQGTSVVLKPWTGLEVRS